MASKDIRSFFVPRYGSKQPPQSTKSENKLAKKCDASQEAKFKKQKENGCNKKKKRACIIESDSDEDPLPIKLSKHEKKRDQEKVDEMETVNSDSSSKHLKETRPTNSKTNRTSQKQDPSKLKPISVDDFFGDVPVKRSPKKYISSKPKVEYSVEQKEPSKEIHDDEDFKCTLKQLDEEKLDKQCNVKEPSRRISPRKIEKSEANKTSPNKDPSRRASPRKIEKPEANKTSPNKDPSRRASPRKIEKPEANKTSSSLAGKLSSRVKGEEKYSPSKKKCHSHFNTLVHRTPSVEIEEEEEDVKSSPSKRKSETPSKEVNGTAVSTSHKNQVSHIPKKSPSKSSVEINKSRQFKSPKKEGSENSPTQEKTPEEKKREKILNYKRFREREGPRALGSKLIPEGEDGCFSGLTFVSTGVLESLERDQVKELIEKYGGKLTQSVSKKTSYLLIGRDAGPAKLEKAENLGTKQINEDEFLELIKTLPGQKTLKSPVKHSRTPVKSSLKDTSRNLESAGNPEMRKRKSEEHYSPPDQPCKKYKQEETVDKIKGEDHKMWVDKHKPTSTKQIIGQQGEKSNVKKLTKWLMNWYKNHSSGKKPPPPPRWGGAGDDGSFFKAALLSGPPGIGKTTSAQLVCQEAGFQYVELNASDTRSKKNLDEEISQLLSNKSLGNYFS
ncbi:replication factor C subunit 1-like, partial [Limulus polyphemus]|uniref:Replication factor C subunit 1-like n=1 Tax=Limulus polyphemus TaxID=6850 RepID=A0ABM1BWU0_LIMPO